MNKKYFFQILLVTLSVNLHSLEICAFQTSLDSQIYSDYTAYTSQLSEMIFNNPGIDFYIFPEYTSAVALISNLDDPSSLDSTELINNINKWNIRIYDFWENLAKITDAYILAGSTLIERDGKLYNRALLFSPRGLEYYQDKVFLGDPEKELLELSAGEKKNVHSFLIKGKKIGLTICRDTYYSVWNEAFKDIDLWIDIKGNELPYSKEYFDDALPSRLREHPGTPFGLTLCTTGSFLGFEFTGYSFLIQNGETLKTSKSLNSYDIIKFRI